MIKILVYVALIAFIAVIIHPFHALHAQAPTTQPSIGKAIEDGINSKLKEIVQPKTIWGYIDRWFKNVTGITIEETWRVVKNFFIKIFDFIVWLLTEILSAFKWLWSLVT